MRPTSFPLHRPGASAKRILGMAGAVGRSGFCCDRRGGERG